MLVQNPGHQFRESDNEGMTNNMRLMTWKDYEARVKDSVLIIPVGSTEQHSVHLPLGTDVLIPEFILGDIEKRINCVIAPTINYGYKSQPTSGGGPLFPGTIDLSGNTMINLVKDILDEFIRDGWEKIILFSAHYENETFIAEAADLITRDQKTKFPRIILTNWWSFLDDELLPKIFDEVEFPGVELEHAAIFETSLLLHYAPSLVKMDRVIDEGVEHVPPYQQFPPMEGLIPESGTLHTARSSSAEKGKMMSENVVENFCKEFSKFFV